MIHHKPAPFQYGVQLRDPSVDIYPEAARLFRFCVGVRYFWGKLSICFHLVALLITVTLRKLPHLNDGLVAGASMYQVPISTDLAHRLRAHRPPSAGDVASAC